MNDVTIYSNYFCDLRARNDHTKSTVEDAKLPYIRNGVQLRKYRLVSMEYITRCQQEPSPSTQRYNI